MKKTQQLQVLKTNLATDSVKARFTELLGKKAPGFISSIISAVSANPKLMEAEPNTIIASAAIAASLDLPINQNLGFAYIVPYSGKAQFQMGYKGFIQLAMRTGQYKTINALTVYEGQIKDHNLLTGQILFDSNAKKSEKVAGYISYFELLSGFEKMFYMTSEEMEAHGLRYSQSYKNPKGRWKLDFEAMAHKTVLKLLLSKYGILSTEMETAVINDQAVIDIDGNSNYPDNNEPKSFNESEDLSASFEGYVENEHSEMVPEKKEDGTKK